MSAGFLKRNEKVLMTLLLLVLAPMFAFTGIMTWWFTQGRQLGKGVYRIHGRTYSSKEFAERGEELSRIRRVNAARSFGPYFDARRSGATELNTLDYLVQLHQLDELGLRVAGGQEQEALRDAALDLLTWYRVMQDRNWLASGQDAQMAYFAEREGAKFNKDEYRRAIAEPRLQLDLSVHDFEQAVLAGERLGLLSEIVEGIATVSEKELYDEYCLDRQKRHFDYVQVSSDRFLDAAREQVDEAFIRSVYDENPAVYRKEAAFDLRIARALRPKFVDPDFDPELTAIEERYQRDRATRYKVFRPADWVAPEGHDPESDFRPLPEVFEMVVQTLREDDAQSREQEFLRAAIARSKELAASGSSWGIEDLFAPEDQEKVVFQDSGWFQRKDVNTLPAEIRNAAVLNGLFTTIDPGVIGEMGSDPVAVQSGSYIYRIQGVETARPQTFEEAVAKVTEDAERRKARELTTAHLEGWVTRIRAEPETTLKTIADSENTTVHTTETPLALFEGFQLRIDGKQVLAGSQLVQALFRECNAAGDVTAPVAAANDTGVYVAELREIVLPDMSQWETARPGLEGKVRNRRGMAIRSQFGVESERRAEITRLFEVRDEANP